MCLGSPPWEGVSRTGATAGVHRGGLLWAKKQKGTRAVFVLGPPPGLLRTEYGVLRTYIFVLLVAWEGRACIGGLVTRQPWVM